MKTALLFSGQPRNLKQSYRYLKKYIIDDLNPDIFIHTWDDNLHSSAKHVDITKVKYASKDLIIELLKPKNYIFENNNEFMKNLDNNLKSKYSDPFIQYSMFYSMNRVNDLKKKYEKENDFIYDTVIRIRFDFIPLERIKNKEIKPKTFNYFNILKNKNVPCDWIFWSDSKTMDILNNCYVNLDEFIKKIEYFTGENILKLHSENNNIDFCGYNKSGFILRDEKFLNLNSGKIYPLNSLDAIFDNLKFTLLFLRFLLITKLSNLYYFLNYKIDSIFLNRFRNLKKKLSNKKSSYEVVFENLNEQYFKIQVFVFSFNKEKYIEKTINNIFDSEKSELIDLFVIDDNSTDQTFDLVYNHPKRNKFTFIKFYRNHGISYLRNFAINNIKKKIDYIFFLDGDDFLNKYKIIKSINILNNNSNYDAVFSNVKNIRSKNKPYNSNFLNNIFYHEILNGITPPAPMSNIIYRTKLFKFRNKNYFDNYLTHLEDWDFLIGLNKVNYYCIKENLVSINIDKDFCHRDILREIDNRLYVVNKRIKKITNLDYQSTIITQLNIQYICKDYVLIFLRLIKLNLFYLIDIVRLKSVYHIFGGFIKMNFFISKIMVSKIINKYRNNGNN